MSKSERIAALENRLAEVSEATANVADWVCNLISLMEEARVFGQPISIIGMHDTAEELHKLADSLRLN